MFYYVRLSERVCRDPQEMRAMAVIRDLSIDWLQTQEKDNKFEYVFRNFDNTETYIFLNFESHNELNELLDQDPLISYSTLQIEPLVTTLEMVKTLKNYLEVNEDFFSPEDIEELKFHRRTIEPESTYFMARKVVAPFSPLLGQEIQDKIHLNTLRSQKAHADSREIADYNPVGKPVGILVMQATTLKEVEEHVMGCEVFVDTTVEYTQLLTLNQAKITNQRTIAKYNVGCFQGNHVA